MARPFPRPDSIRVRGGVHTLVPLPAPAPVAPLTRVLPAADGGLPVLDAALRSTRLAAAFAGRRLTPAQADRLGRTIAARGKAATRLATADLVAGRTTPRAWQARMKAETVRHAAAATRARLSTRNLAAADRRALEESLHRQLGYLDRFAAGLKAGTIPRDARAVARAGLYGAAAWSTAEAVAGDRAGREGYTEEISILGIADHCHGCVAEAARGWVALGSLVPIGERDCLANCRCRIDRRRAAGVKVAAAPLDFGTDTPAMTDWTNRNFAAWSAALTRDERAALDDYSGFAHRNVNALLRGTYSPGDPEIRAELLATAARVDSAVAKGSIPEPVVLWRGGVPKDFAAVRPGQALPTDPAFLSTTLDRDRAANFGHTLIRIEAPAGTPAAAVSRATGGHEQEFLLARDSRLVVTGTQTAPDGRTVISARWEVDSASRVQAPPRSLGPEPRRRPPPSSRRPTSPARVPSQVPPSPVPLDPTVPLYHDR